MTRKNSPKQSKSYSKVLPAGNTDVKAMGNRKVPNDRDDGNTAKDKSFAYFKTRSGKLEREFSRLLSNRRERDDEAVFPEEPELECLPARRYFDALQGPELEILRVR